MSATVRSSSVASGNLASLQVTRPAGVQAGDQLWAIHVCFNTTLAAMTAPSGWVAAGTGSAFVLSVRVWRKTATATETGAYTFGQDNHGTVHVLALQDASTTFRVAIAASGGLTTTVTPSVAPADASSVEIRVAAAYTFPDTVTWTGPTGYTSRGQTQSGQAVASAAVSRQANSSASSGPQAFTASPAGSRPDLGVSISIASAVVTPDVDPPPPFTPGLGTSQYRYVFTRLRDGTYLGDLDLVNVSFDKRILQPGSFSATIPIPNRAVGALVKDIIPEDETVLDRGPGVITCQIYRDGAPWGEYWITGATVGRSGQGTPSIALRGSTLDAYFLQVELQETLPAFVGYDQIDIARELLNHMQSQPYANLGLVLQAGITGGYRDRTYTANEATYGQRLTELAQVDDGFEYAINILAGPSGIERHWVWGVPLGSQEVPALHTFSDDPYGGDILEWREEIDALRGATRWRARGDRVSTDASTSSAPLISASAEATAHLEWWPRLDKTVTYSTVTEMDTLTSYAQYWAATAPGALRVDSITVALGAEPSFTPNSIGDAARIHLDNEWHSPHWRTRRIIGVGITPTSRSDGKESAQLILEGRETP